MDIFGEESVGSVEFQVDILAVVVLGGDLPIHTFLNSTAGRLKEYARSIT